MVPSYPTQIMIVVAMRITPHSPDEDDTVSLTRHAIGPEEPSKAIMSVSRPVESLVLDPTPLTHVTHLSLVSPPNFSRLKYESGQEPIDFDPTLASSHEQASMKYFFEEEDNWEDEAAVNYHYPTSGTPSQH